MRTWLAREILLITALVVLAGTSVRAQVSTASVSGVVEDSTNARLPGVTIKLLNLQTGNENVATAGATGEFLIPGILPGIYSMQVSRKGFAAIRLTGLTLNVGDSRQFVIKLQLSTVEQTIEVDASEQGLNTDDVQMTTVVNSGLVRDLPLNGRSFQDLIAMTPGAVSVSPQVPRGGGFSVNGQSTDTNVFWVDGISGNYGPGMLDSDIKVPAAGQYASVTTLGTTQGLVALDALQEFRVLASTASAEYGSAPGGQFSLLTRQGTDHMHGTVFGYVRNGKFDAGDWFVGYNKNPERQFLNPLYYDQKNVGGSMGLPLMFSRHEPAQSTTDFFGSYERMQVRQRTAPLIQYIPNNALIQNAPAAIQNAFASFRGNSTDFNGDASGGALVEYLGFQPSPPSFLKSLDLRVDHSFGSRFSGFIRFGDTPSGSLTTNILTGTNTKISNQSLTLGLNGQFSAATGNEFRFGWARTGESTVSIISPELWATPVLPPGAPTVDLSAALGSPGAANQSRSELFMNIAGIGSTAAWTDNASGTLRQIELRDTFSWQKGPHLLRFGIDIRNLHSAVLPAPWTIEANYLSLKSVLNNAADYIVLRRNEPAHPVFRQFAAFVQDHWQLARNINVEAGLRWDLSPPPISSDGRDAFNVTGDSEVPATLSIRPRGTTLWNTDWHAFGPRVGIAWQPLGHGGNTLQESLQRSLVLRAGFGVVFDTANRAAAPAFAALGFTSTSLQQSAAIPSGALQPPSPDIANSGSVGYIFPKELHTPYSLQWNVSLEHAAGRFASITLSYVGASGHDILLPQRHSITESETPLLEAVTFPTGYTSQFDSMQLAYRGQYHARLAWMTSYVWAHAMDFGSTNPWALPTRGNAETDIRHNFQGALSWSLPSVRLSGLAHNVSSGWSMDSRYFVRSSYPVTVLGNLFHDPVTGEKFYTGADLVPGLPLYLDNRSLPGGRQLNGGPDVPYGAFQLPEGGSQGNAPRNIARGFGAQQLSFSLQRDIHLYGQFHLQLRTDAFNILNSPDFGYIVPNLTDQLFGQPVLTLNQSYGQSGSLYQPGGPRSLQFMFRILW